MALPPVVEATLARFKAALADRFGTRLKECVLFGSYARGDAHEESDVDVLVVIDDLTERERAAVMDLAYDVVRGGPWISLSPLPYATLQVADLRSRERRLLLEIAREGIAL